VFENNLGIALERTGHYGAAAEAYRAALGADSGYTKAVASLARVDGRDDEPGVVPVTAADLGDSFAQDVSLWSEQRVSQIAPPTVDSDSIGSDSMASSPITSDSVRKDSVSAVTTVSKTDSTKH
jgi:hypothetical protein